MNLFDIFVKTLKYFVGFINFQICFDFQTADGNAGFKKVAKIYRFLAKRKNWIA